MYVGALIAPIKCPVYRLLSQQSMALRHCKQVSKRELSVFTAQLDGVAYMHYENRLGIFLKIPGGEEDRGHPHLRGPSFGQHCLGLMVCVWGGGGRWGRQTASKSGLLACKLQSGIPPILGTNTYAHLAFVIHSFVMNASIPTPWPPTFIRSSVRSK